MGVRLCSKAIVAIGRDHALDVVQSSELHFLSECCNKFDAFPSMSRYDSKKPHENPELKRLISRSL